MNSGDSSRNKHKKLSPFWLGFFVGPVLICLLFFRQAFELLRDAFANIVPIFFTPGLLEITLGLLGFSLVILINYFLRSEQKDEWVYIEEKQPAQDDELKEEL
ncbi:hypothetical protein OAL09_01465 [Verrucomicrobia bacterium]|jgi:hypothetical protein|nr:hypothetical protein [Verrucomicrobiota bacterium]|tara:strand:+ start:101 stop:409 length:309 start_codon:yes stop_codon:yes gene_type:complete